jgi:hypothetical protein
MAFLVALALPSEALAQDKFEIQVYDTEIASPGRFAIQLHTNYTIRGRAEPDYAGEIAPNHVARFTLEPALGITEWLELGAYLQALISPAEGLRYAGVKLRTEFVVPQRLQFPLELGLNVEVSLLPKAAEPETWASELRPIIGWSNDYFFAYVNPIVDAALNGPHPLRPELAPCAKVGYNTQLGFGLGLEYYAGLGAFAEGFLPWSEQQHLLFAVFDLLRPAREQPAPAGWELNAAIGRGLTRGTDQRWIAKAIISKGY